MGTDEEIHKQLENIVKVAQDEFDANRGRIDDVAADLGGEDDSDSEVPKKKQKTSRQKSVPKDTEDDIEKLFAMKQELRNHMHSIRALAKEVGFTPSQNGQLHFLAPSLTFS